MTGTALIAEAFAHLDKASDAAPVSARQAILTGAVEDQRLSLVARLAHALVAARTENGRLTLDIVALRQGHDRLSAALAEANRRNESALEELSDGTFDGYGNALAILSPAPTEQEVAR